MDNCKSCGASIPQIQRDTVEECESCRPFEFNEAYWDGGRDMEVGFWGWCGGCGKLKFLRDELFCRSCTYSDDEEHSLMLLENAPRTLK